VGQHGDLVQTLALFLTPLTPDQFFSVSERVAATGAALPLLHFDAGSCSPREREVPATGGQAVREEAVRGHARWSARRRPHPILSGAVAAVAEEACDGPCPVRFSVDRSYWRRFHSGGEEVVHAGEPAAFTRRRRRWHVGQRHVRPSAPRSASIRAFSIWRKRRHGIVTLAGAVGALAGPKGNRQRPGGICMSPICANMLDCREACKLGFLPKWRFSARVHDKLGIFFNCKNVLPCSNCLHNTNSRSKTSSVHD
jgi:hypothetical protein